MVGLGVMGRNLLLNMADHGFSVAGYDKDAAKVEALRQESQKGDVRGATDIKEFIGLLRRPRAVMMLVPAGAPVDSVIKDLLPHLEKGDLIIDAGNSYFKDTDVRARDLAAGGFPVFYGAMGENLTTRGIDIRALRVGDRLRAGGALLEITEPRGPCTALDVYGPSIKDEIYDLRVKLLDAASPRWGMSGLYASVIQAGEVRPGDQIELLAQA